MLLCRPARPWSASSAGRNLARTASGSSGRLSPAVQPPQDGQTDSMHPRGYVAPRKHERTSNASADLNLRSDHEGVQAAPRAGGAGLISFDDDTMHSDLWSSPPADDRSTKSAVKGQGPQSSDRRAPSSQSCKADETVDLMGLSSHETADKVPHSVHHLNQNLQGSGLQYSLLAEQVFSSSDLLQYAWR